MVKCQDDFLCIYFDRFLFHNNLACKYFKVSFNTIRLILLDNIVRYYNNEPKLAQFNIDIPAQENELQYCGKIFYEYDIIV